MERITNKDVEQAFVRFTQAAGLKTGLPWQRQPDGSITAQVGTYYLQRHFQSKWLVAQMSNEQGGESHPFGSRLRTSREMMEALDFATMVFYAMKYDR